MTTVRRTRLALLLASMALSLVSVVSVAATASGGSRIGDRVPSELWKAYPLDPSEERVRAGNQAPGVPRARIDERTRPDRDAVDRGEQSSATGGKPWVVGFVLVGVLVVLLILRRVATTAPAVAGGRKLFVVASGPRRPPASASRQEHLSRPARPTGLRMSVARAEKGLTMAKWRGRARGRDRKQVPRQGPEEQGRHHDGETPLAVERVSKYSIREDPVNENQPQPPEDDVQGTFGVLAPDKAEEPTGNREATGLTAVGEEVQAVLSSAHDAATTIRRKAEEEAERMRHDAWSAAQGEIAEASRIAEAHRNDAEHIRAEAETSATEVKAAAEEFAEELRTSAEREAARIEQEAQARLTAADANAAQKVERAEAEVRERFGMLQDEIKRHEERLESILIILRGMSSQVEALLARRDASGESGETPDESLEDALGLERSPEAVEVAAPEEHAAQ
jgi:hypothetical protein